MDENLMHELHTLRSQKEDVHNWLDNLGVPRKERGAILSPMGRLEWLYGHCPKAMQALDSAVYATLKKEGLLVNDNESDTEYD